jgi:hypothetical protein
MDEKTLPDFITSKDQSPLLVMYMLTSMDWLYVFQIYIEENHCIVYDINIIAYIFL